MNSEFTIAIHCMLFLYARGEKKANSDEIACSVSTHPARVRKVLGCLGKRGFVATKEGARGGYQLNIPPESITLGELYRIFARGSLQPGWCSGSEQSPCAVSSNIHSVMEHVFAGAERRLETYFDEITLSDVHRLLMKYDCDKQGSGNEPTFDSRWASRAIEQAMRQGKERPEND
ncbi:Rrf2 family transcriptional regulator [Paenibacillus sp. M1]|uniref:Rrf2 family transcriptional regulator n=1 Tax=Paenibacillus haidiansis TaxID=1574488 RepID=A0ABU7VSF3_9BACL